MGKHLIIFKVHPGASVAVFGLGALGLSVIQAAKVAGARYKDILKGMCGFQINIYIYIY